MGFLHDDTRMFVTPLVDNGGWDDNGDGNVIVFFQLRLIHTLCQYKIGIQIIHDIDHQFLRRTMYE